MSLYREARSGRRRLWLAAAAAVLVLAAVAGRRPARHGRRAVAGGEARVAPATTFEPALAALELIPIHYESPNPTTHAAAADQLEVARETIASVEDELARARSGRGRAGCSPTSPRLELLVRTTGQTDRVEQLASKTHRGSARHSSG